MPSKSARFTGWPGVGVVKTHDAAQRPAWRVESWLAVYGVVVATRMLAGLGPASVPAAAVGLLFGDAPGQFPLSRYCEHRGIEK
jgi:hypothetical protein